MSITGKASTVVKRLVKRQAPELRTLDPERVSPRVWEFERKLQNLVVGQQRAIRKLSCLYQIYTAGMNNPDRPIGTMLFLGPTGCGKTHTVEAAAEAIYQDRNAVIRIDCAEFQHSHEVAKLIGSPPGYLGHRETNPLLTQERLNQYHNDNEKITFLLFDEIEKGSDALWNILLAILDKATLRLGDGRKVDFSNSLVIMTSNLGAKEISDEIYGSIGFVSNRRLTDEKSESELDQQIYRIALEATKKKFPPEFMNRVDKSVVFRSLKEDHIKVILDLELSEVQNRITWNSGTKFVLQCSNSAKRYLVDEGYNPRYGAREIKRAVERFLVFPVSNMVATQQIETGDLVTADYNSSSSSLEFRKIPGKLLINQAIQNSKYPEESIVRTLPD